MGELEKAVTALNKKFGKNYIGKGSEILDTDYVRRSTGIFSLDYAVGGGLPERKIIQIAGRESAGKTTTALLSIAETQKRGGLAVLLDVEHGTDKIWMKKLGVDIEKLIIAQPKSIEEVSDTMEALLMSGEADLIVLDSVASAPSDKELDESSEQKSMGGTAKAIGLMVKKITARLNDINSSNKTIVILLNQIRDNVGGYGAPEYCPGGHQLKHHSDILIWLKPRSDLVGGKEDPRGITVEFMVKKNRTAPPMKTGSYDLLWEGRIDNNKSLVEVGNLEGIITKEGYKYTFGDKTVAGLESFTNSLTDPDYKEIRKRILEKYENKE
jgi:recombination protein RecA